MFDYYDVVRGRLTFLGEHQIYAPQIEFIPETRLRIEIRFPKEYYIQWKPDELFRKNFVPMTCLVVTNNRVGSTTVNLHHPFDPNLIASVPISIGAIAKLYYFGGMEKRSFEFEFERIVGNALTARANLQLIARQNGILYRLTVESEEMIGSLAQVEELKMYIQRIN